MVLIDGLVVGSSLLTSDNSGFTHAFLYDGTNMHDLGTLYGGSSSASDINSIGQVTGQSDGHAFLYDNGIMKDLGTTDGGSFSDGYGINDAGHVTGRSSSHAFLYDGNSMQDIGTLGWLGSWGDDINNNGQIVGTSYLRDGSAVAFLYEDGEMFDLCELVDCTNNGWSKPIMYEL